MLEIHRLPVDHVDRLRRLRLEALRQAPEAFDTTFVEASRLDADDWARQLRELPTFVAVLDGEDRGMARGMPDEERADTAYLISMWVAPEARGRGAGDALVRAVAEWARASGFARLVLDVGDRNAAAIALYARHGFAPTGATSTLRSPREHVREHERMVRLR